MWMKWMSRPAETDQSREWEPQRDEALKPAKGETLRGHAAPIELYVQVTTIKTAQRSCGNKDLFDRVAAGKATKSTVAAAVDRVSTRSLSFCDFLAGRAGVAQEPWFSPAGCEAAYRVLEGGHEPAPLRAEGAIAWATR